MSLTKINGNDYIDYTVLNDNFEYLDEELDSLTDTVETPEANNILWTGSAYMKSTDQVNLAQKVTEQHHGIVLVWSGYTVGSGANNTDWNYTFIPKWHVTAHSGSGVWCKCTQGGTAARPLMKYVYVYDSYLKGNSRNNDSEAKVGGNTYDHRLQVLRAVIGV